MLWLGIRDILFRILTSYYLITGLDPDVAPDPDPALFVSGIEDVNKK